ncbi:MAG: hypothetical protein BWY68_00932 [bacterium ADurb.Bin400]|nr:MAG: hypothetical protein BWY68_00932 [bacterium ADurb.Bin400]
MNAIKGPALAVIFMIALVITVVLSLISNRADQNKQDNPEQTPVSENTPVKIANLTNAYPSEFDPIIQAEYSVATERASEVNNKHQLAAIEIDLPADLQPNSGTSRYIYSAEDDTKNNWIITFSQSNGNYIRALIPKGDYMGTLQPINTKLWKFNYVTALQIMEQNGGLSWREQHELQSVKLTLRHAPPKNWLTWQVEYKSKDTTFTRIIDANSGQIISEESE